MWISKKKIDDGNKELSELKKESRRTKERNRFIEANATTYKNRRYNSILSTNIN